VARVVLVEIDLLLQVQQDYIPNSRTRGRGKKNGGEVKRTHEVLKEILESKGAINR
jgi:hypothetical protein